MAGYALKNLGPFLPLNWAENAIWTSGGTTWALRHCLGGPLHPGTCVSEDAELRRNVDGAGANSGSNPNGILLRTSKQVELEVLFQQEKLLVDPQDRNFQRTCWSLSLHSWEFRQVSASGL